MIVFTGDGEDGVGVLYHVLKASEVVCEGYN